MDEQFRHSIENAFSMGFEVLVRNRQARVIAYLYLEGTPRWVFHIQSDEDVMKRLDELAKKSVYAAGESINVDGLYPISDELREYLNECLLKGKLTFIPEVIVEKE